MILYNLAPSERELISIERQKRVDAKRLRYLGRLIAANPEASGKKADWLKFCHSCGVDISTAPRYVIYCGRCQGRMQREKERGLWGQK